MIKELSKLEHNRFRRRAPLWIATFLCLALLANTACADGYVGGLPLTTAQSGTVTGDLWFDATPAPNWGDHVVTKTFRLPEAAVAEPGRITWARLYISVYCGSMTANYSGNTTIDIDANGDDAYESSEYEILSSTYSYPGKGGTGTVWLNDHMNRVTSDYLMWYNLTNAITSQNVKVRVTAPENKTSSFDGRIKVITLVVAYNDPSSSTNTTYWVNQGHDVCSYLNEENKESVAVGSTNFGTNGISDVTSATLTVDYMASHNGYYGFPTYSNTFSYDGAASGHFTNQLEEGSDVQGNYSGVTSWDVTSSVTGNNDVTLGYARNLSAGTGLSGYFKIPLAFLVVKSEEEAPKIDLTISGLVNTVPASAVFAREANIVKIPDITNNGSDTATDITVSLYASDVSSTNPVNSTTIDSLSGGNTTTVTLIDPTIRDKEGGTVTYTAKLDPENLITESNETNNNKSSYTKSVKYNGYKGKGLYWEGGSNITTKQIYNLSGNMIYSTQPDSAYEGVGWNTRTETWSSSNLFIPNTATIEKVLLYFPYNWDQTAGGYPWLNLSFNGNIIENGNLSTGNGKLYRDWSNFGGYSDYEYGLCVFNVTDKFSPSGNILVTNPYEDNKDYSKVALYPSTLVVVYSDPNENQKLIFINEECDELGVSASDYGTTMEEATAYALFTNQTIDLSRVQNAILYSFVGSAGPDEGNLLFNGNTVATNAWNGNLDTASAEAFDVKNYLTADDNIAGIQGTTSGGMVALQQILVVDYSNAVPEKPDLIISSITPKSNELFANEANSISAKVENNGSAASGPFNVSFNISGYITSVPVEELLAGENRTLSITDPTLRTYGNNVTVTVTADSEDSITESNETNNARTLRKTVVYNGYKGKRWTNGSDINTQASFEGRYGLIYSSGNTSYKSSSWTSTTYSWTAEDLPIPEGTTVVEARLYQPYSYNTKGSDPAFVMSFNGNNVNPIAKYTDRKNFGSYNAPYGLYVYNVTAQFNSTGNSITLTPESENKYALWGAYLVVVYSDSDPTTTSIKKIYINDEFDMIYSYDSYYAVDNEEAIAYAPFSDVNTTGLSKATAVAVLASANEGGKSKFFFNNNEYTGFSANYSSSPQTGFSAYDVTGAIQSGNNTAKLQSYDANTTKGDNMYAMNVFLVAEYQEIVPVANFNANVTSGKAPLTVKFTDTSAGTPTSWAWDFNNDGITDSEEQNPIFTYETSGNYTVNLTVANKKGNDTEIKDDYIKVREPVPPKANFSANRYTGICPLIIQFTDTSQDAEEWNWDFGDGSSSTKQNVSHTYTTVGNYTVNLTVSNIDGTDNYTTEIHVKKFNSEDEKENYNISLKDEIKNINDTTNEIVINRSNSNVKVENNTVKIRSGKLNISINTDGITEGKGNCTNATIETDSETSDLGGNLSNINTSLSATLSQNLSAFLNGNVSITTTVVPGAPDNDTESAFLTAGADFAEGLNIAYSLVINKIGLDGVTIKDAYISMNVPKAYVDSHGGIDDFVVMSLHNGKVTVLDSSVTQSGDYYIFTAYSPDGFSVKALASYTPKTETKSSSGGGGGSSSKLSIVSSEPQETGTESGNTAKEQGTEKAEITPSGNEEKKKQNATVASGNENETESQGDIPGFEAPLAVLGILLVLRTKRRN